MATVYTRLFGRANGAANETKLLLVVPASDTWVVRDVVFYTDPAVAVGVQLYYTYAGTNTFLYRVTATGPITVRGDLHQVLPNGALLYATSTSTLWQVAVTGWQLLGQTPPMATQLPAPRPIPRATRPPGRRPVER